MDQSDIGSINKHLKVIIALLLQLKDPGDKVLPLRDQIEALHNLGMTPKEIGEVLSRSSSYINKEISILRKSRKKGDEAQL